MKRSWIVLAFILLSLNVFSKTTKVAKIILLRGTAKAKDPGSKVVRKLKKGDELFEGTILQTSKSSVVKAMFTDKSIITLGPKGQMVINKFPKNKAGLINLIKGQLRSQVTKDPLAGKDAENKLYIKTKTAAMGVRGTDFQTTYNPDNQITSLVTFTGEVAMAQTDPTSIPVNTSLGQVLRSDKAVVVKQGQYSGTSQNMGRTSAPVKISPVQLSSLKDNASFGQNAKASETTAPKKVGSLVPPGVNSKIFIADNSSLDREMAQAVGEETIKELKDDISAGDENAPPPEGFVNNETGEFAPPGGGLIDLNTGLYIPPPPGSPFDPNTGVYILPPQMGVVDDKGNYVPPAGFELKPNGEFARDPSFSDAGGNLNPDGAPAPGTTDDGRNAGELPPPPTLIGTEQFGGDNFDKTFDPNYNDGMHDGGGQFGYGSYDPAFGDGEFAGSEDDEFDDFDDILPPDYDDTPQNDIQETTVRFKVVVQ